MRTRFIGRSRQTARVIHRATRGLEPLEARALLASTISVVGDTAGLSGVAGTAVHVNISAADGDATQASQDLLTHRYEWDFGDTGSSRNTLVGYNAAHVYDAAGTYTIRLREWDGSGTLLSETPSKTVTITADSRPITYIAEGGMSTGSGSTTQTALSPAGLQAWFANNSPDNRRYLLQVPSDGTFDLSSGMRFGTAGDAPDNILISSYGGTSGQKVHIKRAVADSSAAILYLPDGANRVVIENMSFDSFDGTARAVPRAVGPGANVTNLTLRNSELLNVSWGINLEGGGTGVLMQNVDAPNISSLRTYFVWMNGSNITLLDNYAKNSVYEHIVRGSGWERLLAVGNDFRNAKGSDPDGSGVSDNDDSTKGVFSLQNGNYAYLSDNDVTQGAAGMGPLNQPTGTASHRTRWVVYDGNRLHNSTFSIEHGTEHAMIRNNVITNNVVAGVLPPTGIDIKGAYATWNRKVDDVTIAHNTMISDATRTRFLWSEGYGNSNIRVLNNLLVAPQMSTHDSGQWFILQLNDSSMAEFGALDASTPIDGNVWAAPNSTSNFSQGGVMLVGDANTQSSYRTPTEWNAINSKVGTDLFADTPVTGFTPSDSSADVGAAIAGVAFDYNGNLRTSARTAGAVETDPATGSPPAAPIGLSITNVTSTSLTLTWTDTSSDETGFKIERKTGSGGTWAQINTTAANVATFNDSGLSANTTYYYRVASYNGNGTSSWLDSSAVTTGTTPPAAPSNLIVSNVTTTSVQLDWTDNSTNETGFKIERKLGSGGTWAEVGQTSSVQETFVDTGLTPGATYYYRVAAYNGGGNSSWLDSGAVTTNSSSVPTAATTVTVSNYAQTSLSVNWLDASSNETGFKIERMQGTSGTWSQIGTVGAGVQTYADSGLTAGTTYTYRVRAYNGSGDSSYATGSAVATAFNIRGQSEVESATTASGFVPRDSGTRLGGFDGGDYLFFRNADFGTSASSVSVRLAVDATNGAGSTRLIKFYTGGLPGSGGTLIATLDPASTGGWDTYGTQSVALNQSVTGVKDLYIVGEGLTGIANLDWVDFS